MFPVHFDIRIDQWQALHCIWYSEQYILHRKEIQHTSNIASTRDIPYLPLRMGFRDLNMGMTHTMTNKDMSHIIWLTFLSSIKVVSTIASIISEILSRVFKISMKIGQLYTAPSGQNILETLLRFDVPLVIVIIKHLNKIIEILFFDFTTSAQLSRTAHRPACPDCSWSISCEPILIAIGQLLWSSTNHTVHVIIDVIFDFFISAIFHFWRSEKWKIICDDVIGCIELDIWNILGIFRMFI